jgi:hypothetical protein
MIDQARMMHVQSTGDIDARDPFPWYGSHPPRRQIVEPARSSSGWIIAVVVAVVIVAICVVCGLALMFWGAAAPVVQSRASATDTQETIDEVLLFGVR